MKPKFHLDQPDTDIYVGDCREVLAGLPAESVDLVFGDPPFNWNFQYNGWHDKLPREDYLEFTHQWLDGCIRVLKPNGSLWVNIPDDSAAEIVLHLKSRKLDMINWCIWHFRFGQCRDCNFIVSKVHVLYFARDKATRIWNPDAILEASDRASIYGDSRTTRTRRPGLRVPFDVWYGPFLGRIQGPNKERRHGHANQIPEAYMDRVVRACSNPGDLVLDPFLGSGTTATVARALGRRSIGVEFSPANAASACERIQRGLTRVRTGVETNSFMKHRQRKPGKTRRKSSK
jgi:DNA modification methylase